MHVLCFDDECIINNDSLINTARIIDFLVRVQKDARENCLPCTNMTLCTLESFALTFLLGLNPKYRIQVAPHEKYVHDHWHLSLIAPSNVSFLV